MTACSKAEELWDDYWNGVFDISDGWQIELSGNEAIFVTQGSSKPGISTGSKIASGLSRVDEDSWKGSVRNQKGYGSMVSGTVDIIGDVIVFNTDAGETYGGTRGVKGSPASGGGSSSGGGSGSGSGSGSGGSTGGGTTTPTTQTLIDQKVTGNKGDQKIFTVTLPTSIKELEVITSEKTGEYYYNTADLFVRYNAAPVISTSSGYKWTATRYSINSNREQEIIRISAPQAGKWYITVYGYNTHFTSHLTVKVKK